MNFRVPALLLIALTLSCGSALDRAHQSTRVPGTLLHERFADAAVATSWMAVVPSVNGALARLEDGAVALTMPAGSGEKVGVRRKLELSGARGQRLRLAVRVKTQGAALSRAKAEIAIQTDAVSPSYRDLASSQPIHSDAWTWIHTTVDVAADAGMGAIDLTWTGEGRAWFSDVTLEVLGPVPTPAPVHLSAQQVANLVTFTRAAALIHYLHPADEAAALDWNGFLPAAIAQVLKVTSPAQLVATLRTLFAPVAPTVAFTTKGELAPVPARSEATHLVRWRQYGFGNDDVYKAFREGRDPDGGSAYALTRVPLAKGCKKLVVRAASQKLTGEGKADLFVDLLQGGRKEQLASHTIVDGDASTVLETDVASEAQAMQVGVHITGRSGATLHALTWACDAGAEQPVDLMHASWELLEHADLYRWTAATCNGRPCATMERTPLDPEIDPERDIVRKEIGNGITIQVPLAVWATADRTLPAGTGKPLHADVTIDDLSMRLAVVSAAWSVLSIYYPYFADQHIDWLAALPGALHEAANARSPTETQAALSHLLAEAHDDHISIKHPVAPKNGVLPVQLRRFGDRLIVSGGLPAYLGEVPIGSEVLAVHGVPALTAFTELAGQSSAATEGFRDYIAAYRLVSGTAGTFGQLRIRGADGRASEHTLPFVSIDLSP